MSYTCRGCGRTFPTELDRDLHADRCVDNALVCRSCGERFDERRATEDGWRFECPECGASGIGDELRRVGDGLLKQAPEP